MSLYTNLIQDLKSIGIEGDFTLILKPYSKSWFGAYRPQQKSITLYIYKDIECTQLYSYKELFLTLVHEAVHYLQWSNPYHTRLKGIMHDHEFHTMYSNYSGKAKDLVRYTGYIPEQVSFVPPVSMINCIFPHVSPMYKRKRGGNNIER